MLLLRKEMPGLAVELLKAHVMVTVGYLMHLLMHFSVYTYIIYMHPWPYTHTDRSKSIGQNFPSVSRSL